MVTRGVASVRSPVKSLRESNPTVTHDTFVRAIIQAFCEEYHAEETICRCHESFRLANFATLCTPIVVTPVLSLYQSSVAHCLQDSTPSVVSVSCIQRFETSPRFLDGASTASGVVGILEDAHPDQFLELVDLEQEVRMRNVTGYTCMVGVT